MEAILYLAGLGSLICFILVLIKLFKKQGVGLGILGIICALYTFIWGWIHAKKQGIQNIMLIWTILIVLGIVINYVFGVNLWEQYR
ncbi:hypothetical protein JXO52_05240 [bacterium]|nr:hypothetical protein [bacterium]